MLWTQHMSDASLVHEAVPIIDRLIREHLYDPAGEQAYGSSFAP